MVDMSPKAVTYRLRLMGELWELSVKLMNSKIVESEPEFGNTKTRPAGPAEGAIPDVATGSLLSE